MTTDESLTDYEKDFYGDALNTSQTGPKSTGYGNPINQEVRFKDFVFSLGKALVDHCSLDEMDDDEDPFDAAVSVLDVGCGTGDLLAFLHNEGSGATLDRYVGIDRDPRMIEVAKRRFDSVGVDATWIVGDLVDLMNDISFAGQQFDVVTSIAVFALKPEDWDHRRCVKYAQEQIRAMVSMADKMSYVTLFSNWKNYVLPTEMNVDPTTMFNWAMTEFGRVDMSHAYAPHDFSLAIYPGQGVWRKAHA